MLRRITLIALLAQLVLGVAPAQARGPQEPGAVRIAGAAPAPLTGARVLGPVPPDQPLSLVIGLTPRQPDLLNAYLRRGAGQQRLPALTPDGFGRLFGLSAAEQDALTAYLSSFGLRVVRAYPDHLLLDVAGTAGQVSAAFGVALVRYQGRDGRTHDTNTAAPRLPASLAGLVSTVVGLRDDAAPYRPLLRPRSTVTQLPLPGCQAMRLRSRGAVNCRAGSAGVSPVPAQSGSAGVSPVPALTLGRASSAAGVPRSQKRLSHRRNDDFAQTLPWSRARVTSVARDAPSAADVPAPPPSLLTPTNIRSAYDITPVYTGTIAAASGQTATVPITGTGQTVALFELAPYNPADIAAYDGAFGLTSTMPTSIPVDGGATDAFGYIGQLEASLDIELAQAVAPGARLLVYNGPASPTGTNLAPVDDVYARIVNDDQAQMLSTSWGQCEASQQADQPPDLTLVHTLLAQAVAEGMTVLAATGDQGAYDCTTPSGEVDRSAPAVDYPASDPLALAVGGTTLQLARDGSVAAETGWANSGGGLSLVFTRPDWQVGPGVANSLSNGQRQVPDVAMDAGQSYAILENGGWIGVGGTSAGPPIWSGLLALANEARYASAQSSGASASQSCGMSSGLGDIHPELYALGGTTAYRDITTGPDNGLAATGRGWDYVTGWGAPDASVLLHDLVVAPALSAPSPCPSPTPLITPTSTPSPTGATTIGVPSASTTSIAPPATTTSTPTSTPPLPTSTATATPTSSPTATAMTTATATTTPTATPTATTTSTSTAMRTAAATTSTSLPTTSTSLPTTTSSPTASTGSVPTGTATGAPTLTATAGCGSVASHASPTPIQLPVTRHRTGKPMGPGHPHGRRDVGHTSSGLPRLMVGVFTWWTPGRDELVVRARAHWIPHGRITLSLTIDGRELPRVALRVSVHGLARYVFPVHLSRRGRHYRYSIVLRARAITSHGCAYRIARLTVVG